MTRLAPTLGLLCLATLTILVLASCGPAHASPPPMPEEDEPPRCVWIMKGLRICERTAVLPAFEKPVMEAPYWPPARVWLARGTCTVTKNGKCARTRCKGRYCI